MRVWSLESFSLRGFAAIAAKELHRQTVERELIHGFLFGFVLCLVPFSLEENLSSRYATVEP
jgi:hypothetical protein